MLNLKDKAIIITIFTFIGQLLSIYRDRLFASNIGIGQILDTYYFAFRVPDFLFAVFTSIVSTIVLIPLLSDSEKNNDYKNFNILYTLFFILSLFLIILSYIFMPNIMYYLNQNSEQTILFSRILLLQPFLLSLSFLYSSFNQYKENFLIYSLSPVIYNLSTVLSIIYLYPIYNLKGIIYGVLMGSLFHFLLQYIYAKKNHFSPKFIYIKKEDYENIIYLFKITLPRAFVLIIVQLKLIYLAYIFGYIGDGYLSSFNLALSLYMVPISLFSLSLIISSFPKLVKQKTNNDILAFKNTYKNTFNKILIVSLFSNIFIIIFANIIIKIIYGIENDYVYNILFILSFAIIPASLELFIARSMYAFGYTYIPAKIALISFIIFVLLFKMITLTLISISVLYVISTYISFFIYLFYFKNKLNNI